MQHKVTFTYKLILCFIIVSVEVNKYVQYYRLYSGVSGFFTNISLSLNVMAFSKKQDTGRLVTCYKLSCVSVVLIINLIVINVCPTGF